jgi:hypothetical protein
MVKLNTASLAVGAHKLHILIADGSGRTAVVAQISIQVAGAVGNCGLFGDDFNGALWFGEHDGYVFSHGNFCVLG